MTRKPSLFLILLAFTMSGVSHGCLAQSKLKHNSQEYDSHLAKQKIIKHLKKATDGKVEVFGIKQLKSNSGKVWRVKFMRDGKIQYMDVAPQSATD